MKSVEGWIELERRDSPGDWKTQTQFRPELSIEQARTFLVEARVNRVLDETEYRLVYVRVETSREVQD